MGKSIAFLGLGVMGYPMAGHLARAGHTVTVYNRTPDKASKWLSEFRGEGGPKGGVGHGLAGTPKDAAEGADIVFACVGNDDDLKEICSGSNGAFAGMGEGAIFCDHTTVSARVSREMAAFAEKKGVGYLDAPVSGGEAGAQSGQLTVMVGGAPEHYAVAEPSIAAYAKMQKLLGPVGAGQTCKMVNQICLAGTIQGLAEAVNFAMAAGLDADEVLDTLSKGAAQSWQMDNRWPTMAKGEFDFGFAVNWMRKDLAIVMEEARALGVPVPVASLVDQFYQDVQNMDGGRQDTSSLLRRLRG